MLNLFFNAWSTLCAARLLLHHSHSISLTIYTQLSVTPRPSPHNTQNKVSDLESDKAAILLKLEDTVGYAVCAAITALRCTPLTHTHICALLHAALHCYSKF